MTMHRRDFIRAAGPDAASLAALRGYAFAERPATRMNRSKLTILVLLSVILSTWTANLRAENHPDVLTIAPDLENPAIIAGDPAPGKMVLQFLPAYAGTEVAHALYLPTDWAPGKRFPVLIEYCGNGSRVRDGNWIGYGITRGNGFIWAVLPFVSQDRHVQQRRRVRHGHGGALGRSALGHQLMAGMPNIPW